MFSRTITIVSLLLSHYRQQLLLSRAIKLVTSTFSAPYTPQRE